MANNCPVCSHVTVSTLAPDAAATCPRCGRTLREDLAGSQQTIPPSTAGKSPGSANTVSGPSPAGKSATTLQRAGETLLGRYTLIRELGRGTFGVVWLARDEQLGRQVALKMPRQEGVAIAGGDRFTHEAQIAARIHHPGIVSVFDVQRLVSGDWIVVMEYIEGRTLADALQENRCLPDQAASWAAQIAARLENFA